MVSFTSNPNGHRLVYIKGCTAATTTATTWTVAGTTTDKSPNRMYESLMLPPPTPDMTFNAISAIIKLPAYNGTVCQGIVFVGWQTSGITMYVGGFGSGAATGYSTRISIFEMV